MLRSVVMPLVGGWACVTLMGSSSAMAQDGPGIGTVQDATEVVDPDANAAYRKKGLGFGGIPAAAYDSDEGLGLGVVGSIFGYDGKTAPYRWALGLQIFATSKNVHHHRVNYDILNVGGLPLRIFGRVKFEASRAEHFCGYGDQVSCDKGVAEQKADEAGLEGDERDTFLKRYYKTRYVMPFLTLNGRWMFRDKPHRVEVFGGWRGNWFMPGDLTTTDLYEGSLYSQVYPQGERGLVSVVQAGIMIDNRRNEPAPFDGYWVEASIRGSSPWWGSKRDWSYFGFNTTLRGYLPLGKDDGHLVLADRFIVDGIVGDTNSQDIAWAGGSQILTLGGGASSVRGVRQRRYRGKFNVLQQAELRFRFATIHAGETPLEFGIVGFNDVALTAGEWSDVGTMKPYWGTGAGLRFTMNQNFVVRADAGFAPSEDWSPGVYITVDNTF